MAKIMNVMRRSKPPQSSGGMRLSVFNITRAADSTSRQVALSDDFLSLASSAGAVVVIPPPYNVSRLFQIIHESNMLPQCIDAFTINTVRTGWEIGETTRGIKINESERAELQSFIEHANSEESLADVMDKVYRDRESCGFGFLEIIRDATQTISLLRHCTSLYTRLCAKDPNEQLIEYEVKRGRRTVIVKEYRRFRRFVQIVNGQHVWFREFGDPRRMSFHNGAYEGQSGFDPSKLATEIKHFKLPSDEPYGVPRWISQLPSILGSREAEEVNMRYFQENTVPPMLLLIGGGRLTAASYRHLSEALNKNGVGKDRQNKIMLLEAVGEGDSLDGKNSTIELKVEKLSDTRQSDGLFRAYDEANMAKVRSAFRLPPIVVGLSQDVNFATASTSAFVAESQVFAPEREMNDNILNKFIINGKFGLNLQSCKLVSRTPSITSPEMLIKTLTALNVMGAVTPRSAQTAANTTLQTELHPYPEKGEPGYEEWMDKPIIFSAKQAATHDEQGQKDDKTKELEEDGDVGKKPPKNGEQ